MDSLYGINCYNDIVQLDQNDSIEIDALFNDIIDEVSGTPILTIIVQPINGTAVISANKINYSPNKDFFGNDQLTYKVTKGGYECTAKVSIKINQIISNQSITDIVVEQITTILQSDEYWDIGLPIGTKLSITENQLSNFNLVGGSWGKGSGKFAKWAICNSNNGTDDYKGLTTRGYDVNDSDYDDASSTNNGGVDTVTLVKNNIPPHRHGQVYVLRDETEITDVLFEADKSSPITYATNEADDSGAQSCKYVLTNTSDGTDNYNNQDELPSSPSPINIRNKYFTEIMIQKIL